MPGYQSTVSVGVMPPGPADGPRPELSDIGPDQVLLAAIDTVTALLPVVNEPPVTVPSFKVIVEAAPN